MKFAISITIIMLLKCPFGNETYEYTPNTKIRAEKIFVNDLFLEDLTNFLTERIFLLSSISKQITNPIENPINNEKTTNGNHLIVLMTISPNE